MSHQQTTIISPKIEKDGPSSSIFDPQRYAEQISQALITPKFFEDLKNAISNTSTTPPIKSQSLPLKQIKSIQEQYKARAMLSCLPPIHTSDGKIKECPDPPQEIEISLTFLMLHYFLGWLNSLNKAQAGNPTAISPNDLKSPLDSPPKKQKEILKLWDYFTFELHKMLMLLKWPNAYKSSSSDFISVGALNKILGSVWQFHLNLDKVISSQDNQTISIPPQLLDTQLQEDLQQLYEQLKKQIIELWLVNPEKAS